MASRQLPSFLKRPGKKDNSSNNNNSGGSGGSGRSLSLSAATGGSIRFSSLGADDHDFFSVSTRASPPPSHPLEERDEDAAEEALIADYSPMSPVEDLTSTGPPAGGSSEAERAHALGESLMRQASVSSPPAVSLGPTEDIRGDDVLASGSVPEAKEDADEAGEAADPSQPVEKRKREDPADVGAMSLLEDIDKTFQSVPKPPTKQRKKASDYAKARVAVVVPKQQQQQQQPHPPPPPPPTPPSAPSSTSSARQSTSTPPPETPLSQSLPPSHSANSIFDQADALLEKDSSSMRRRLGKRAASSDCDSAPSSSPRHAPPPPPPPDSQAPPIPGIHPVAFSAPAPGQAEGAGVDGPESGSSPLVAFLRSHYRPVGAGLVVCLLLLRLLPSASFLLGFLWGGVLALGASHLYRLLTTRSTPPDAGPGPGPIVPDLRDLPPPSVPHIADEPDDAGGVFRGWLNELYHYRPESYHINQTSSVFVSLDGTQLRIQRPRQSVQKRAMWNEALPGRHTSFVHQRHFDMMGARVTLEPCGLVKKRVWSKKYPICLVLGGGGGGGGGGHAERHRKTREEDFEWLDASDATERIYLFARTCREKEEWFRRFEAAARGKPLQLSLRRIVAQYLEEERNSVFAPPGDAAGVNSSSSSGGGPDGAGPGPVGSASVSFSAAGGALDGGAAGLGGGPGGGGGTGPGGAASAPDIHLSTGAGAEVWSDRLPGNEREPLAVTYTRYMARFMPADWLLKAAKSHRLNVNYISCDPQMLWLNAILGRGVWDLLREQFWADKVKQKIQNKLRKIHLPYFVDELTVVEINLGRDFPVIRRAGKPFLNSRGLWVELEIAYSGGSSMALETKVNLMKLRKRRHDPDSKSSTGGDGHSAAPAPAARPPAPDAGHGKKAGHGHGRTGAYCSEEEDSAESTTDSELDENPDSEIVTDPDKGNHIGGGTSRKLLRLVDRISRSSYFHKAIENKFIQRGMEYVSNTRIVLHVEVRCLAGTLLVNIPPPPTDRLWYGFKPCPRLVLAARPKVGEKELTMARLTEWIEKKLELEFQRIFVMPNMDDLVIPLLLSGNPEAAGHPEGAKFSSQS